MLTYACFPNMMSNDGTEIADNPVDEQLHSSLLRILFVMDILLSSSGNSGTIVI
jgi:hypothetical protein